MLMLEDVNARLVSLENRFNTINDMLSEAVMTGRNAYAIHTQLQSHVEMFETLSRQVSELIHSVKTLMIDEKYLEEFTDEELKKWYMKTTLTNKDVKTIIGINFPDKKDISLVMINNYINGKTKDTKIRSFLGKYFRDEATKRDKKTTNQN